MILQKQLQYGFNGYEVPRAPRSARKRPSSCKKTEDHNQMCAFDLLATIAGKLLLEGDDLVNAINNEEIILIDKSTIKTENEVLKPNVYDQESFDRSFFVSEIIKNPATDACSGPNSGITVSDCKLEDIKTTNEVPTNGNPPPVNNLGCNLNLVIRDDDENSCECTHRPTPRIGDRRIRRLSASKQDMCRNKKSYYKYQRSLRDYPFKKRKTCQLDNPCDLNNESGSSLGETHQDSQVKLKIKSFRVPEFFIELPETATVSSLKRTVMEAVTAIFSGELHVGVMLQGKKIRDDNKTLLQTGICHDNKIDALGFTLEPNQLQIPSFICTNGVSPPGTPAKVLTRYLPPQSVPNQVVIEQKVPDALSDSHVTNSRNIMESDGDMSADSRALVAFPAVNAGPLAVVPTRKSKCAEVAHRRTRRPFSVSEVEALVEAVEKLGTGRWRDVKLGAFDDAKHRTYVDLKDKWKTLVHTARISPQQRRGEPVPQELLDRVLTAHGYWSHHQPKNHTNFKPKFVDFSKSIHTHVHIS